jgi:hypothetical protein
VAQALIKWPDDQVFSLLLEISKDRLLYGVWKPSLNMEGKMLYRFLLPALGDDFYRPAAEKAFRKIGAASCPHLLKLAAHRTTAGDIEIESSRRRRRSALRLFAELHGSEDLPESVRLLITDNDPQVALLACSICLPRMIPAERREIAARLIILLNSNDWMLRTEVEDLLIHYYADCRSEIERNLALSTDPAAASLRKVMSQIK